MKLSRERENEIENRLCLMVKMEGLCLVQHIDGTLSITNLVMANDKITLATSQNLCWDVVCNGRLSILMLEHRRTSKKMARGARRHIHDDVIKWKLFPRCWPFVRGIHRSPVNSHKGQMARNFDKQSWRRWFKTPSRSLWRHCNGKFLTHRSPKYARPNLSYHCACI